MLSITVGTEGDSAIGRISPNGLVEEDFEAELGYTAAQVGSLFDMADSYLPLSLSRPVLNDAHGLHIFGIEYKGVLSVGI